MPNSSRKSIKKKITFHNWLEMQKVVTFVRFLMEHPVFIMYIEVMCMTKEKKKKKFFFGYARIRTRGHLDHKF